MTAWDEAQIVKVMALAITERMGYGVPDDDWPVYQQAARAALAALAPHLAARDAAVWAQACEAAMRARILASAWCVPDETSDLAIRALTPPGQPK